MATLTLTPKRGRARKNTSVVGVLAMPALSAVHRRVDRLPETDFESLAVGIQACLRSIPRGELFADEAALIIRNQEFMLSGRAMRTILAYGRAIRYADYKGEAPKIIPNCCVLPRNDTTTRIACLASTTGIGTSLADMGTRTGDPQNITAAVGVLNAQVKTELDGREPGLMHTLPVTDPNVYEFMRIKSSEMALQNKYLRRSNHSLVVDPTQWNKFVGDGRHSLAYEAAELASTCGEPGILFSADPYVATAPCGEVFMDPYEVCMLGTLNVAKMCEGGVFDAERTRHVARIATGVLDALVDVISAPSTKILRKVQDRRRIGLGVVGFATALDALDINYASQQGRDVAFDMGRTMADSARVTSCGRNASLMALPPTGATAACMGVSYAIEPHFSEALNISPEDHVRMLAAWQTNVDNGISKTVNMPMGSSADDVLQVWSLAHELKCKGITVYCPKSADAPTGLSAEANASARGCTGDACAL